MTIGFDINEANIGQRVGVNQVAFAVFKATATALPPGDRIIALTKERPLPDLPSPSEKLAYEIFGPKKMWVLIGLTKRLFFNNPKIDVLFSPSHYTPLLSAVPSVIYLMDLSYERFGTDYFTAYDINQLKRWTPLSIRKAKHVLTISEFSKSEIVNLYHTNPDKISVVYPGFDRLTYHSKIPMTKQIQVRKKYGLTGKYLLYVGTLQGGNRCDEAFRAGLAELEYIEGKSVFLEVRAGEGKLDRLGELAADLVRLKVDVIVSLLTPVIRDVRRVTTTVPIVRFWPDRTVTCSRDPSMSSSCRMMSDR